jgi:hypothetical protein
MGKRSSGKQRGRGSSVPERMTDRQRDALRDAPPLVRMVMEAVERIETAEAKVGTLEVQLCDLKRQLVTAMEQARAAEKKANRLGCELEQAHSTLAEMGA